MKIAKARQNSLGRVGSSSDQNLHNNNIPISPVTAASPVAGASGSVNTN